jgi:hypothetical protein
MSRFIAALLLLSLSFVYWTAEAAASTLTGSESQPFSFTLGLRAERHALGTGLGGQAAFDYSFFPNFGVDIQGRAGGLWADKGQENSLYLALAVGIFYLSGRDLLRWNWRVGLRVNHVHIASLDSWGKTPWENLSGDSNGGVRHRTGAELAIQLDAPAWIRLGHSAVRWGFQLNASLLPSSEMLSWSVNAGILLRFQPLR